MLAHYGCSSNPPQEAPIHLVLDTTSVESGCNSAFCDDYKMRCGATISIRLTDPDTGAQLFRDSGEALSLCLAVPSSDTICSLSELASQLQLFDMPPRTVRVEVALWNQDDVSPAACPQPTRFELFDALGRPQAHYSPQPAFAGAAYFRAGEQAAVTVPLACPNPMQLDIDTCEANLPTDVQAFVTDLGTLQRIREEQAQSIRVSVGETRVVSDNLGNSFSVLEAIDTYDLRLNQQSAIPVYSSSIPRRFGVNGRLACTTTLEGTAQATPTVHCQEVIDKAEELDLSAILIRKSVVDDILAAMQLGEFPESGLVIGRVVNEGFTPVSGVAITASEGSVVYLSSDMREISPVLSSSSGYFASTDVPADSSWTATHFDGRQSIRIERGGLLQGKVSTVLLRLSGDVIGQ